MITGAQHWAFSLSHLYYLYLRTSYNILATYLKNETFTNLRHNWRTFHPFEAAASAAYVAAVSTNATAAAAASLWGLVKAAESLPGLLA